MQMYLIYLWFPKNPLIGYITLMEAASYFVFYITWVSKIDIANSSNMANTNTFRFCFSPII